MINIQDIIPLMKDEEWKSIYNGKYYVSNYGRVYSSYSKNILSQFKTKKGYLRVTLWKNGNKKGYLTHRLVAENFIENTNKYPQINHIDGNKQNNCADNLEWCTGSMNIKHAVKTGLIVFSEERRKKISEFMKTQDHSKHILASILARKGKHLSTKTKELISKAQMGALNHKAKKIICVETQEVFDCMRDACRKYNLTASNLSFACGKENKTFAGYHWKYIAPADDWTQSLIQVKGVK